MLTYFERLTVTLLIVFATRQELLMRLNDVYGGEKARGGVL